MQGTELWVAKYILGDYVPVLVPLLVRSYLHTLYPNIRDSIGGSVRETCTYVILFSV